MSVFRPRTLVLALVLGLWVAISAAPALAQDKDKDKKKKKKKDDAEQQAPVPDPAVVAAQQRQAERDTMMAFGRRLDGGPKTPENAKERLDYWEGLKLSGMTDPEVFQRYQGALKDHDEFQKQDAARKTSDSASAAQNAKLERATRSLQSRNIDDAESVVEDVLTTSPDNQRALILRDRIRDAKRARQFKITLLALAAAAMVLIVAVGAFAKWALARREKKGGGKSKSESGGSERKAVLKIIDGIGRGKLYTIEGDVFRLGAAASEKPEEKNQIVVSDDAKLVSRFHCSILKKDGSYFLLDSSLNGTAVNDKPLDRGDHHRLRDGDEFTLADVSRVKFLLT